MKPDMFDRLDFAERALAAIVEAMRRIPSDFDEKPRLYAALLHASIVQLCGGCVAMARSDYRAGIPVLMRTMFEAIVDLDNLVKDATYVDRMDFANWSQLLSLFGKTTPNPQFAQLAEKPHVVEEMAKWRSGYDALEKLGRRGLHIEKRCESAGRQSEYVGIYKMLCLDAHNNVTALAERHVGGTDDNPQVWAYGDEDPKVLARRISIVVGWMLQSADFAHGAFRTGFNVQALQQEHQRMRETLEGPA